MSSTVTIRPNGLVRKDIGEQKVIRFDWDTEGLAVGVTITSSTWSITAIRPADETPVGLLSDNPSVEAGSRSTKIRITDGVMGSLYRLTNVVVTNESPSQRKERSCQVSLEER